MADTSPQPKTGWVTIIGAITSLIVAMTGLIALFVHHNAVEKTKHAEPAGAPALMMRTERKPEPRAVQGRGPQLQASQGGPVRRRPAQLRQQQQQQR